MNQKKQGWSLIKFILVIVLIIVFLSLLGINLEQDIVQNEVVQTNLGYTVSFISNIWENHLATPFFYVWNDVFIPLLWQPFWEMLTSGNFMSGIENMGNPGDFGG